MTTNQTVKLRTVAQRNTVPCIYSVDVMRVTYTAPFTHTAKMNCGHFGYCITRHLKSQSQWFRVTQLL